MSGASNGLRQVWEEGRPACGVWSSIPSFFAAEVLASAQPDYVCVDLQHGLADLGSVPPLVATIAAAGSVPLVRVAGNEPWLIGKVLDAGALGVIVPLVESGDEAARAVGAARYPPNGHRSYGPIRAAGVVGSADPRALESEVVVFVMVETRQGLERVEEIAATPGLTGIYIGPSDLAVDLGLDPTAGGWDGEHAAAIAHIRETCARHGIIAGIHCPSGAVARRFADAGFGLLTVAMDRQLLRAGAVRELADAR